jgi:aminopeptidase N
MRKRMMKKFFFRSHSVSHFRSVSVLLSMRNKLLPTVIFLFVFGVTGYSQLLNKAAQSPTLYYSAENHRSDTFDLLKLTINLEIGNTTNMQIGGNTQVRFAPKINNRNYIRFDLLKLIVDSVKESSTVLTYTYNDTILKVNFSAAKNITDTSVITVYYHGQPPADALWGGFYFDNSQGAQYAYNLGVGFAAKPHNYGRVFFPCFDNFVERSKYEFNITSDSTRRAYCNGQLISDNVNGAKRTRKWVLSTEIPSYLASVTLANYRQVNWTVNTLTGVKPITLVGVASDTSAMKSGFINLKSCIQGFENYYGPFMWNRFGYCLVPFNGGAMEHATNISYPRFAIGNLAYEDLYTHELSHHWWGDLITCETQEDMWINEGWATFSAHLFYDWQYGKAAYLSRIKSEHDNLLHFLHKQESGFRAVSGVPHDLTYGDHVYKKGADVAHTLRGYMGDVAFFNAIKYVMQQKAYQSINSLELRDLMQTASGQNLSHFFNNWVLAGGWPHFAVDSVKYNVISSTNVDAVVSLQQKLYGATALYTNAPLELSFFKNDWTQVVRTVTMSGASSTFTVNVPFQPVYYALNYDSKISDATSHQIKTIKAVGATTYTLGKLYVSVANKGADSSLLRVVHHYVKPDPFKHNPAGHKLSDQHYWTVEGILSPGFYANARFNYDGNKGTSGTYIYMDTLLTIVNADSIHLFYRKDATEDWRMLNHSLKQIFSSKSGYLGIDTLKLGEYTFGNMGDTSSVGVKENELENGFAKVFPNPARQKLTVELKNMPQEEYLLTLQNIEGKIVLSKTINQKITSIDVSQFAKGSYVIKLEQQGKVFHTQKLLFD